MPKPKIYSHSRLKTHEQCPFKFKLRYIDKIKPPIEKTIEAHLGSSVHAALEWLYTEVMNRHVPEIEELINYYAVKWQDSYTDDTIIVKKEMTQKDYFNKGVKFLTDYYTKHCPFSDNTLEVEKRILIDLDSDGKYKIQGFIDRLVYNPETGEYEIHDYKTANNMPFKEEIENDRQLAIYSLAIKEIFGHDKKTLLVWHYLAHNQKITSQRTDSELLDLKNEIIESIKKIEAATEFPTKKSQLCNWCEYKPYCPEFCGQPTKTEKQSELDIFGESEDSGEESEEEVSKEEMLDIW